MPSRESRNRLRCSGLLVSRAGLLPPPVPLVGGVWQASEGCLYSWDAYFRMGAYIREDLVRTEMGAYIHGVINLHIHLFGCAHHVCIVLSLCLQFLKLFIHKVLYIG